MAGTADEDGLAEAVGKRDLACIVAGFIKRMGVYLLDGTCHGLAFSG